MKLPWIEALRRRTCSTTGDARTRGLIEFPPERAARELCLGVAIGSVTTLVGIGIGIVTVML